MNNTKSTNELGGTVEEAGNVEEVEEVNADGSSDNEQSERTFTQDDVNRIVKDRLARVKTETTQSEMELDLIRRENALYAKEQILSNGLPEELETDLSGLDKETVDKVIKIIAPYAKQATEPIRNAVASTSGNNARSDSFRNAMGLK